ncbi:MAG: DUF4237 domain-containing protein [Pseudonocardiaceae bacterium]|nr:DUF4237 domain-containing protein [Pseudonocardiaceae bacterium]
MRQSAKAWREAGDRINALAGEADGAAGGALDAIQGEAGNAARKHWSGFVEPDSGQLTGTARGCADSADRLETAADEVGSAKVEIVRQLVSLAKNNDAAEQAANAGHPMALAGLRTAVDGTATNVENVRQTLVGAVGSAGGSVREATDLVNPNPGAHGDQSGQPGSASHPGTSGQPGQGGLLSAATGLPETAVHGAADAIGAGGRQVDAALPDGALLDGAQAGHGHGSRGGHGGLLGAGAGLAEDAGLAEPAREAMRDVAETAGHAGAGLGQAAGDVAGAVGGVSPGGGGFGGGGHGGFVPDGDTGPIPIGGGAGAGGQPPSVGAGAGAGYGTGFAPGVAGGVAAGWAADAPTPPSGIRYDPPGAVRASSAAGVVDVPHAGPAAQAGSAPGGPAPAAGGHGFAGGTSFGGGAVAGGPAGYGQGFGQAPGPGAGGGGAAGPPAGPAAPRGADRNVLRFAPLGDAGPAVQHPVRPRAQPGGQLGGQLGGQPGQPAGQGAAAQPPLGAPRQEREAIVALFLVHMFPIGHLPVASDRPARQLPPPPEELDYAAGLRFSPHDHPDSELIDAEQARQRALEGGEPVRPGPGLPADDPSVDVLAEGHDPLGGQHERDWERRFLVPVPEECERTAEYVWPPSELYPEGGCEDGEAVVLEPDTVLDRFGTPEGRVFGADGIPFAHRSLPPELLEAGYRRYRVSQPLPVWSAVTAGWFGQPGGGQRYRTVYPATDLVALGYLEEITTTEED